MLYNFLTNYSDTYSFLNFFDFLTVRTGLAVITSMIIVFLIGDKFINYFSTKKITNPIRSDGPEDHLIKKIGTPTMGGVLILIGLFEEFFYGLIYSILTTLITFSFWNIRALMTIKKLKTIITDFIKLKLIQIIISLTLIILYKFIDLI